MIGLPTCPCCSHQFTWRQTLKNVWKKGYEAHCPACENIIYATGATRTRATILTIVVPLSISFAMQNLYQSFLNVVLFLIIFYGFSTLVSPFIYRYKNHEEPLFRL